MQNSTTLSFDPKQPNLFWEQLCASQLPFEEHLEELFLVAKMTDKPEIKKFIDDIFAQNVSKDILKGYKSRAQIYYSGDLKDYEKNVKSMISYAKASSELNVGRIFQLLGYSGLNVFDNSILNKEPQYVGRFNGIKTMYISGGFPQGLPEEIGDLESLEVLEMQGYHIKSLPKSFSKLKNLTELELRTERLEEIPESLKELPKLSKLRIEGGHYSYSQTAFKLPEWLGELSALKELQICYVQEESFPEKIFSPSLEKIYLAQCTKLKKLPKSLATCTQLKTFIIATSDEIEEFPEGMSHLPNLETLEIINMKGLKRLDGNLVYGAGIKSLKLDGVDAQISEPERSVKMNKELTVRNAQYLGYILKNPELFPKLEVLRIYSIYNFEETQLRLHVLPQLKKLEIYQSSVSPEIFEGIEKCSQIEDIEIFSWSEIYLHKSFSQIPQLKRLAIKGCSNLNIHFETLPDHIEELIIANVQEVHFDNTSIKTIDKADIGITDIFNFENIGNLRAHSLDFYFGKKVDGADFLAQLPESIRQIQGLRHFKITAAFSEVVHCFDGLQELEELELQGIDFSHKRHPLSKIEIDFSLLPKLKKLKLGHYTGDLEAVLGQNSGLEILELDNIPKLKTLPSGAYTGSLKSLSIESCDNFISMKQEFPALEAIKIYFCQKVSRDLLGEISACTSLKKIDLSYLSPSIDTLPQDWSQVEYLKIDHLAIKEIPPYINEFTDLHTLVLDGLSLQTLPKEMGELKKLRELSIRVIYFKELPDELSALRLKKLRLWFSKFSGNNLKKEIYKVLVSKETELVG